ncbi:MAG TPA: plastocyanin/azurin family copper-binding protein [Gaiellaceae bacterium]|nr:plastocyanin/azurin family copper-binding protein [Gaiellaceae bacterium]
MSRRTSLVIFLFLTLVAVIAAGCGGGDDNSGSSDTGAATDTGATTETSGGGGGGGGTLEVAAVGDELKFDKTSLEAPAGSVTINFTNPSASIPHNVTIEGSGIDSVATETVTGEASSVKAELEAGTYDFYCSVGGHRAAGMEGTLTVN